MRLAVRRPGEEEVGLRILEGQRALDHRTERDRRDVVDALAPGRARASEHEVSEFFEGGLDLTAKGLGGKCFNTFIGDTRSSQSLTATLFDFARGVLGECGVAVTTTPSQSTRQLGSTDPITDLADIGGTTGSGAAGPTPTGTMTFFLCGPGATSCQSGSGTQVGSPVTLGPCTPDVAGHACVR